VGRQGKVTDEMRRLVLQDVQRGISYCQIAPHYGVTETTIRRIVHGQDVAEQEPDRKRREGCLMAADREQIAVGIARGESCPTIAARIALDPSTVWREIGRNGGRTSYQAHEGEQRSIEKASRPRPDWIETKPWSWTEAPNSPPTSTSRQPPASRSTSAIPIHRGNAAPTRTGTASSDSSCHEAWH